MNLTNDNVFTGVMLSDGYLRKIRNKTEKSYLAVKQVRRHDCFLKGIKKHFKQFGIKCKIHDNPYLKETDEYELTSTSSKEMGEQRKRWYPDGIKIIPPDIKLNGEILAWWEMGDGSSEYCGVDGHSVKVTLYTNCFTVDEIEFLRNKFMELGIETTTHMKEQTHPLILISKSSEVTKFMDLIKPYMLPCFKYKIKYPNLVDFGDQAEKQRIRTLENYHNLSQKAKKERNQKNWSNRKDVANPERKDRYHSDPEFREICKARSNRNYKPHPRIREIVPCMFCKSNNTRKHGKITTQTSSYNRVKCNDCNKIFQHNKIQIVPLEK